MRSVEKRGATVEEATAAALAELGVASDEAEVEVLQSPRRGLFGGGKRALVRVTTRGDEVATLTPSPDETFAAPGTATEVPGAGAPDGSDAPDLPEPGAAADEARAQAEPTPTELPEDDTEEDVVTDTADLNTHEPRDEEVSLEERMAQLDEESELAADFVEGLLDLLDLPGDIVIEVTEDTAVVNVSDVGSGLLIGRRGATLDALQELVRSSTQRQTERRSHVRVDVEGYRARQLEKLRDKAREAIAQVRETGEPYRLEPMDAYERKMMHNLVAKTGGVTSTSEGAEPKRRVVILPE